jgi:hypothetical protein
MDELNKYIFDANASGDQYTNALFTIERGCMSVNSQEDLDRIITFLVRGEPAKISDYGELIFGPVDDLSGFDLCRAMAFIPYVYDEYFAKYIEHKLKITVQEYHEICQALVQALTQHSCSMCS